MTPHHYKAHALTQQDVMFLIIQAITEEGHVELKDEGH
jgi:hypothetical protein